MCIGTPMQVVSVGDGRPWCEGRGARMQLDTLLIGEQPPGTWVLAFQGSAIRVLTADDAMKTNAALDALEAVLAGAQDVDAFFGDLIENERTRTGATREPSR